METISERLSQFAIDLQYKDLPEEVIRCGKRLLLDTMGVGLGGYLSEPSRITRSFVAELGGKPESTVIGSGEKTLCSQAAFLNGVMMRYLDFGDVYHGISPCHPSENIPVALAVGERQHATGKDILVAIVLGYEFMCRFTDAIPFDRYGWLHVSLGGYVVPLVAGKLLGLDREQMVHAVGISGSTNHALRTPGSRSMMKAMGFPLVAKNGINAALMAQRGLTGPKFIIETMNRTVGHDADLTPLIRGGEKLRILSSKIKPYAAAGKIQPSLTALFSLLERHSIQAEEVEAVTVRTYEVARAQVAAPETYQPANKESADQSLPYCIAIALIERALGPGQFREGRWRDPQVLALMAKVTVLADAEFDKLYPAALPADVEILTKQGERFRERVDYPKGDLRNPVTDEEVEKKFRGLVSQLMTEARASRIIERVNRVEGVTDIGELMELLVL